MRWRAYLAEDAHESVPVETTDGAQRDPDRYVHPGRWSSQDDCPRAIDHMSLAVFPWSCGQCPRTVRTAAGTGIPSGWVWREAAGEVDFGQPCHELVCAACADAEPDGSNDDERIEP